MIDYILCNKTNLNNLNKLKSYRSVFSNYNGMKLEVSDRKITWKSPKNWKLNNIIINNSHIKEN